MRRLLSKARFVHARLWRQDMTYRWAFLAGPPPLIGLAAATLLWFGLETGGFGAQRARGAISMPWAHYAPVVTTSGAPIAMTPAAALPAADAQGRLAGLTTGWRVQLFPMTVDAAYSVKIQPLPTAAFQTDDATVYLDRVIAAAPPEGVFFGGYDAFLVVRTAGTYGLTVRMQRISEQSADCLQRFAVGNRRVVSNLRLNLSGKVAIAYDPVRFDLKAGLYRIGIGFSCWRGDHMVGPGRIMLMIQHPGELTSRPATHDEVQRPIG